MILESIIIGFVFTAVCYLTMRSIFMLCRLCSASSEMEDEYNDELNLDEEPH